MRFVHITDTHIGPTPDFLLRGFPALSTLEALVERINNLPFQPDFVLHTGDMVDDTSEASYALARPVLEKLKYPVYYVIGNHDRPLPMQRALLGRSFDKIQGDRFDYQVEIGGFILAVFDTRGTVDPAGTLTEEQLKALRDLCTPDGPPLIIAVHHQPVLLDSPWLDEAATNGMRMRIDCSVAFQEAIAPARDRIRGVFFGHIHRGFQAVRNGILYCSAPSGVMQFQSWPNQHDAVLAEDELPGFGVVTVTPDQTIVRHFMFPRPG
jgi:Icc protein